MTKQRNDRLARLEQAIPAEMRQYVFKADPADPRPPSEQLDDAIKNDPSKFSPMVILLTNCERD